VRHVYLEQIEARFLRSDRRGDELLAYGIEIGARHLARDVTVREIWNR
jgi:hypothetical protein